VNKFFRSTNNRDSDLVGKTQTDKSEGKGIYNTTIKTDDKLQYKREGSPLAPSDPDLGEEVYGCIALGFGAATLEKDAEQTIKMRKIKREDSEHFKTSKHSWYEEKNGEEGKAFEDCALIPQENIPLVSNSKFAMNYWDDEEEEIIEIPKGAGFSSGTMVRPVAFTEKAEPIPDGMLYFNYDSTKMYSHTLSRVPLETAHAILNRCKEISLTGGLSHVIKRENMKCTGVEKSTFEVLDEVFTGCAEAGYPCGKGTCVDLNGYKIELSCASSKKNTDLTLTGDIDMTAYRHKQMAEIWAEDTPPKILDISGNYFRGSLNESILYSRISSAACLEYGRDSASPVIIPPPKIEQIAKFEKQTKLSSGCLAHIGTNKSILSADLGENLAKEIAYIDGCNKAYNSFTLKTGNKYPSNVGYDNPYYPSGVRTDSHYTCPDIDSGPRLRAFFDGNGWDDSKIGLDEPEDLYTHECKEGEDENYPLFKSKWISTGIESTVSGDCVLGLRGLDRYDLEPPKGPCDCINGGECADCKTYHGKLAVVCACEPMCSPAYPQEDYNECPDMKKVCEGNFRVDMEIGKYVGAKVNSGYYNAAVPLLSKMGTAGFYSGGSEDTENLTLWWYGIVDRISRYTVNTYLSERSFQIYPNKQSADKNKPSDNSIYRYESLEVGVLTVRCEEWSIEVPLYTVLEIAKEKTCKGSASSFGSNAFYRTTDAGQKFCKGCTEEEEPDCCGTGGGCGGPGDEPDGCCNVLPCGINDPCGYSVIAIDSRDACEANCDGGCADCGNDKDTCCGDDEEIPTCAYAVISELEPMGCYSSEAYKEDVHTAEVKLTLEFKLFKEME
jgi:hypothetical protein